MESAFYNHTAERETLVTFTKSQDYTKYIRKLSSADFHLPEHQRLFAAMSSLVTEGKAITIPSVADELTKQQGSDADMTTLISAITENPLPPTWAIAQNIEIIQQAAFRRNLYAALDKARERLTDGTIEAPEVMADVRQKLREMTQSGHTWHSQSDVLLTAYQAIERRQKGEETSMPTGIPPLDKCLCGLHRGELTIVGARPAVGKSALGMHIALASAEAGFKVAICSREMTDLQLGTRILARGTQVAPMKLRTGELADDDWAELETALQVYQSENIQYLFSANYVEDLCTEAQNRADSEGLDLLLVDYLQLMQTRKRFEKDYLRLGYITKQLKDLAIDLNISVLALAQVGRSAEGNMPTLAELRGSGDIEQTADNVIFMHRPESVEDANIRRDDRSMFNTLPSLGLRYMVLDVAKQRQGENRKMALLFNPARMRFQEINRGMNQ